MSSSARGPCGVYSLGFVVDRRSFLPGLLLRVFVSGQTFVLDLLFRAFVFGRRFVLGLLLRVFVFGQRFLWGLLLIGLSSSARGSCGVYPLGFIVFRRSFLLSLLLRVFVFGQSFVLSLRLRVVVFGQRFVLGGQGRGGEGEISSHCCAASLHAGKSYIEAKKVTSLLHNLSDLFGRHGLTKHTHTHTHTHARTHARTHTHTAHT